MTVLQFRKIWSLPLVLFFCGICNAQEAFPTVIHYEPPPVYPAAAIALQAYGPVDIWAQVDDKGDVISADAISGNRFLGKVSEIAAKKWKFSGFAGTHYLTLRFLFAEPSKNDKDGYIITGPYSLQFTPQYFEIIDTSSSPK